MIFSHTKAMSRLPSTTALMCFEASARLGSFTNAARELHLTQGAVSRQIIALEERLNVQLFVRRKQSLLITDSGRYYLGEIGPLLQQLERAGANVMALKGKGGNLSLSVGASVGTYWLIPRLPSFTRMYSEITLNLATRVGAVDFSSTTVDASLEFGDGLRPGLEQEFVLGLEMRPYASNSWIAIHGKHISSHTQQSALVHHSTVSNAWPEWFLKAGLIFDGTPAGPRYDLMSMALNAAVAGLGAVLLPSFMADDAVATGRLKLLSRKSWTSDKAYYLVYPKQSVSLDALTTFRQWLLEQTAAT
jgi:LysR family transcriptional regulator, glycine cleavage system transcriptional activator